MTKQLISKRVTARINYLSEEISFVKTLKLICDLLDLINDHVHLVYAGVVQHVRVGGQVVGKVGAVPGLNWATLARNIPIC